MFIDRYTRLARAGLLLAALGATGAAPLMAQQAPAQAQVITLERAIEIALERNPTVRQAENSARLSTLSVRQEQRSLLPSVNLNTGTTAPYGTGSEIASSDPALTAGLSSTVQVSNVYSKLATIEQAKLTETGSEQTLERAEQTVVFNVMSGYLTLIETQEQIAVQEQSLAAAQAQETQIQAYVNAGTRPISDLYQQQATTASARLGLVQAQRALVVARMNLIRILQLDPNGEYVFEVPELGALSATVDSLDMATLSQQALANRPDLRASELSLQAAQQGVKIANASRWPTLNVTLGYNASFNSAQEPGFLDQLDQDRGGSLQIGISVPVLNFTNSITRERARIQVENAQIGLESARQTVATEVRTAYLDLQLAEEQLRVAEAQAQAAELALQTAQQRYNVGAATLVELTQARTSQVRAASDLVSARYGLVFQSRLMEYYLGSLETE